MSRAPAARPLEPLTTPLVGTHLIEASAGTGKTYTITTLVLRLVLEKGLDIEQVLVVTFTRAATAELRDRVRERLRGARAAFAQALDGTTPDPDKDPVLAALVTGDQDHLARGRRRLDRALQGFDRATISTIHGFCQRMLQENAFESGAPFSAELVGDDRALQREILLDWWASTVHDAPPALVRYLAGRGVSPDTLAPLVAKAVAAPDAPVLPDPDALPPADPAVMEAAVAAFEEAWEKTRAIWAEAGETVRALLQERAGALNGNKYRNLDGKLDALEGWLTGPASPLVPSDAARFGQAALSEGTKKGQTTPEHGLFAAMDALLAASGDLAGALEDEVRRLQRALVDHARAEVVRRKRVQGVWSFDDLLVQLRDALGDAPDGPLARRIRSRFPAALIDEFQDTDPVQYAVFRTVWAGRAPEVLFLIGDPKQAIYAFRGADIFAYLAARADATAAWTMKTNWRSDPGVLRATEALFRRGAEPFVLDGIDFESVQARRGATDQLRDAAGRPLPALEVAFLERDGRTGGGAWRNVVVGEHARLPARAAARVVEILGAGWTLDGRALQPGQVAVLTRTRRQAAGVQDALRLLGVPSVLQTDASVFDTAVAGHLRALLRAVVDPRDARAVRGALATPLWGRSGDEVLALAEAEDGWAAEAERLQAWAGLWGERGFMAAFRRLLDDLEVPARILAWPDGERVMTDLLHLAELLQARASDRRLGPEALLRWYEEALQDERRREDEAGAEAAQLRLESDADAVQLVTMHKAKGLEYPVVLCPFLASSGGLHAGDKAVLRFHDPAAGDRLTLDLRDEDDPGRADALAQAEREAMAESLRLLYVALTRARHRCEVVWGALNGFDRSPLGYLLHPPPGAPAGEDRRAATAKRIKGLGDAGLLADLADLAAAADGALAVRCLDDTVPPARHGGLAAPPELTARAPLRQPRGWSTSSFSRLAQAGDDDARVAADEARDHDERAAPAEEPAPVAGPAVPLDAFPRGARAGNLLHDVLEHADFDWTTESDDLERLCAKMLRRYGEDAETWAALLAASLHGVLRTPLGAETGAPRLCDIGRDARVSEMEFILPVAHGEAAAALTPGRLADALAACPGPGLPAGYPEAVRRLRFSELQGWMRGFIDLVFTFEGRWYVVDYKSNHLGPRAGDYRGGSLDGAMVHHHYVLQYHLYCVALHRLLRRRLAGYDPARHFGGVAYLFLRGMAPEHPPGCGVFTDRPPPALLDGLSAVLDGGAP